MRLIARCTAAVSQNGTYFALVRFARRQGHFIGQFEKSLGELAPGKVYEITIREVGPEVWPKD